ncbi:MAG: hypothetical protein QOG35_499 [Solirubrobacteraceae bacterium]|nr:hypothetical protein [Solirubrobacteraceae bacterium]
MAPGFEAVAEEFERNLAERGDGGGAFAAVVDGEPVVDLWGGSADPEDGRPWREDTLAVIFSGTKGLVALCLLMLADRGQLDVDAPVSRYWPEFGAHGKGDVLVRDVMSHQARLPGVLTPVTHDDLLDDRRMAALLANQPRDDDPRAAFVYHALTYGWLCGELARRVDGRSIGRFFAGEVAGPLGLDAWIGLPAELEPRVARLHLGPGSGSSTVFDPAEQGARDPLFGATWGNPPLLGGGLAWNTPAMHAAEIPGAGAVASARSLARLYGCLARGGELDGVRLLSASTLDAGLREQVRGYEALLEKEMAFGLGFALQGNPRDFGAPLDGFGHCGAGGSCHGAWPTERVGFSYTMNQLRDDAEVDPRPEALVGALHAAVAQRAAA